MKKLIISIIMIVFFINIVYSGDIDTDIYSIYHFDDNLTESSNQRSAATYSGSISYVTGSNNNGVSLDTTATYLNPSFPVTGDWTWAFWIDVGGDDYIIDTSTGTNRLVLSNGKFCSDTSKFCIWNGSFNTMTTSKLSTGSYHYLMLYHNSTAGSLTLYIDNNGGETLSTGTYDLTGNTKFLVSTYTAGNNFDELAVWNRSLTSTERTQAYTGVYPFTASASNSISISTPSQYYVYQRNSTNQTLINITGTYIGNVTSIEARFSNQNWTTIDASPSGGTFTGNLLASTGQGNISVRFSDNTTITDAIQNITIGDIYVIAGQSNHEGRSTNQQLLNSSNPYNALVYREDDAWKMATDPIDTGAGSNGSPFPLLANYISQNHNVPVIYITTAAGGTSITVWQKGSASYDNMYNQINEATHGLMKIKSILFFQGETDAISGMSYATYSNYLTAMTSNMQNDFDVDFVNIGQIAYSTPAGLHNIRQAQIDSWSNINITPGAVTYDIGPLADNLHMKSDAETLAFAKRWYGVIDDTVYGTGQGRGPIKESIYYYSNNDSVLYLKFNNTNGIEISNYTNTVGSKVEGFRISDGVTTLTDSNIVSTTIVGTDTLKLVLDSSINSNYTLDYASNGADGYGKSTVKNNYGMHLPQETLFDASIVSRNFLSIQEIIANSNTFSNNSIYSTSEINFSVVFNSTSDITLTYNISKTFSNTKVNGNYIYFDNASLNRYCYEQGLTNYTAYESAGSGTTSYWTGSSWASLPLSTGAKNISCISKNQPTYLPDTSNINSILFQESPNSTTPTGTYNASFPVTNMYDGNYSSYSILTGTSSTIGLNYNKSGNYSGSIFSLKANRWNGTSYEINTQNFTLPSACFNAFDNYINMRIQFSFSGFYQWQTLCYNSTGYYPLETHIVSGPSNFRIYEEGVYWLGYNEKSFNLTNLSLGDYNLSLSASNSDTSLISRYVFTIQNIPVISNESVSILNLNNGNQSLQFTYDVTNPFGYNVSLCQVNAGTQIFNGTYSNGCIVNVSIPLNSSITTLLPRAKNENNVYGNGTSFNSLKIDYENIDWDSDSTSSNQNVQYFWKNYNITYDWGTSFNNINWSINTSNTPVYINLTSGINAERYESNYYLTALSSYVLVPDVLNIYYVNQGESVWRLLNITNNIGETLPSFNLSFVPSQYTAGNQSLKQYNGSSWNSITFTSGNPIIFSIGSLPNSTTNQYNVTHLAKVIYTTNDTLAYIDTSATSRKYYWSSSDGLGLKYNFMFSSLLSATNTIRHYITYTSLTDWTSRTSSTDVLKDDSGNTLIKLIDYTLTDSTGSEIVALEFTPNVADLYYRFNLTYNVPISQPTPPPAGGGGGGGTGTTVDIGDADKIDCDISISPKSLSFRDGILIQELRITNNELFSIDPDINFEHLTGDDRLTSQLGVSTSLPTINAGKTGNIGIRLNDFLIVNGNATARGIIETTKCKNLIIPVDIKITNSSGVIGNIIKEISDKGIDEVINQAFNETLFGKQLSDEERANQNLVEKVISFFNSVGGAVLIVGLIAFISLYDIPVSKENIFLNYLGKTGLILLAMIITYFLVKIIILRF